MIGKPDPRSAHIIFLSLGVLTPRDDMTPVEAVRVAGMMVMASAGSNVDFVEYAKLHGLERHFMALPDQTTE